MCRLKVLVLGSLTKRQVKSMTNRCIFISRQSICSTSCIDIDVVIRGPDEGQVARAKVLTEDLLEVVRAEHAKVKTILAQQQMELHQAQVQYAAYSAYAVCIICSCIPGVPLRQQLYLLSLGLYSLMF